MPPLEPPTPPLEVPIKLDTLPLDKPIRLPLEEPTKLATLLSSLAKWPTLLSRCLVLLRLSTLQAPWPPQLLMSSQLLTRPLSNTTLVTRVLVQAVELVVTLEMTTLTPLLIMLSSNDPSGLHYPIYDIELSMTKWYHDLSCMIFLVSNMSGSFPLEWLLWRMM